MVPTWRDENGFPIAYESRREAEIEIAEMLIEHLRQFLVGERDFEDACTTGDFILLLKSGLTGRFKRKTIVALAKRKPNQQGVPENTAAAMDTTFSKRVCQDPRDTRMSGHSMLPAWLDRLLRHQAQR
ncbi:hypothetical protein [Opitutus terrae]|uniref:hypothetical protein n=1 Tax=Opitutus terrae TaxID=107709 RepID=UPI001391104F|nr:hypothetical protein [Opitutus terrae]